MQCGDYFTHLWALASHSMEFLANVAILLRTYSDYYSVVAYQYIQQGMAGGEGETSGGS